MDDLVTTEWLAGELGAPDLGIVDASWFLPEQKRDPAAEYAAGHIAGAVFLDLNDLSDETSSVPSMLPRAEKFASRMQKLGLGDGSRIVLYDDSPLHTAARAWWMFRMFGVKEVAILDGGLARWKAEGRPLSGEVETQRHRHFTVQEPRAQVRTLAEMKTATEQIADARSFSRFAGSEPEPRAGVVPGHIPGSANVPYARLFAADGVWKRGEALRAAFTDSDIDPDRPVTATCGSGVTAAVLVFGLHLLGKDAALYDGSWAEWGSDPATPKAVGAA
ncbi:3-mercaptopyruvate sulfurtransferase [soil metagenome]